MFFFRQERVHMAGIKRRALEEADRRLAAATLGELRGEGLGVFCWCNRCGHSASLDSGRLAAEFGPSYPVPEVGAGLRCSGCGSKDVATRPDWPGLGQVTNHS
jgi:hypothetical protein